MNKISIFLFLFVAIANIGWGQTNVKQIDINNVKMDTDTYLYGEQRDLTKGKATEIARKQLKSRIENWVKELLPDYEIQSVIIKKIESHCQELSYKRGREFNVCVYVKKDDIYALLPVGEVANHVNSKSEIPKEEEEVKRTEEVPVPINEINSQLNSFEKELCSTTTIQQTMNLVNSPQYRKTYYYRTLRHIQDLNQITGETAVLVIYRHSDKSNLAIVKYNNIYKTLINLKTGSEDSLKKYTDCNALIIQKSR